VPLSAPRRRERISEIRTVSSGIEQTVEQAPALLERPPELGLPVDLQHVEDVVDEPPLPC